MVGIEKLELRKWDCVICLLFFIYLPGAILSGAGEMVMEEGRDLELVLNDCLDSTVLDAQQMLARETDQ